MTEPKEQPQTTKPSSGFPKWAIIFLVLVFAAIGIYTLALSNAKDKHDASKAQLYLATTSTTVSQGSTVTVSIRLNPPTTTDGVDTTVSYDPTELEFVSADATNSAFPAKLTEKGGNGTVRITRGVFPPGTVNGDSLVSNITFKAVKATLASTLQVSGTATYKGSYLPTLSIRGLSVRIPN